MEQRAHIKAPTATSIPRTCYNNLAQAEDIIQRYEYLLYRISVSLGCNDCESQELVGKVRIEACKNYADGNISLPLRVWLVKDIVHKCIFKRSCQFFSEENKEGKTIMSRGLHEHPGSATSGSPFLQEIPLSYKVAYILNTMFRFTVVDVAEILNITPYKVKERLQKAEAFMKDQY